MIKQLIKGFITLFIGFIPAIILAQTPFIRTIEVDKTIQDIKVQEIVQDKNKLMWLGTNKGLYRYDGTSFKAITIDNKNEEISVTSLFCDSKGVVWVGLKKGSIFYFKNDSIKPFDIEEGNPKETINGIAEDTYGNIWFATYGEGLYVWNHKNFYNFGEEDGLDDESAYCLVADNKGNVWCGTDAGITACSFLNEKKQIKNYSTKDGLSDNIIKRLIWDKNGFLWFGTDNFGIGKLYPDSNKVVIPESFSAWNKGSVESMLLMEHEVWIGTNENGLIDYEFSGNNRIRNFYGNAGFNYSSVQCLFRDDEGNIWIASKDHLAQSPGERIEFLKSTNGIPFKNINSVLVDRNKNVWYSDQEGLHQLSFISDGTIVNTPFVIPKLKLPFKILSIYQDAFGFIWIGTFDHGVFRIEIATGKSIQIDDKKGLTNQSVLSISGKQSTLWLASLSGAIKIELGDDALKLNCAYQVDYFNSENGLNNNFIYQVLQDRKGRVWFAQDGKGISMLDRDGFHQFGEEDGIKAKTFYSITEDINGGIWFASANNGLYRYKNQQNFQINFLTGLQKTKNYQFYHYDLSNGLQSLHISGLCADNVGNVAVVYNDGIGLFNLDSESFSWLEESDGINTVDADLNTTSLAPDGVIWVGAKNQFIEINTSLEKLRKTPYLSFNIITALLDPFDFSIYQTIPASKNHITFSFQGIWFSNPTDVNYQYKMEGLNRDWINTRDKTATFPDLDPGRYTLRLRCSKTTDFSGSNEIIYSFAIANPMYKQWWFTTLLIIVLIAITWIFLKIRDQRVNFVQRLEKEKLASQFETLKNQVNPHFLFNSFNTLANIIDEDKGKAIEYIEKLTDFFRQILIHREKDLIKLEEELEIINDYVYLQQQRFENALVINITVSENQSRHYLIPPLALQLLVENAIKHNSLTTSNPLIIDLYFDYEFFVVKNNLQPKLNKEPSTGTGLQNITRRMEMLGLPSIEVEKTETHFIVKFKLADKKQSDMISITPALFVVK